MYYNIKKVKWSRYRLGVAHRVGRGTALLFHDRGARRGWVVSSTPRPHFTLEKDPVPILQVAGWATGLVWTGGKSRPHRDSIPDRPARSSVAIATELPGQLIILYYNIILWDHRSICGPSLIETLCGAYLCVVENPSTFCNAVRLWLSHTRLPYIIIDGSTGHGVSMAAVYVQATR